MNNQQQPHDISDLKQYFKDDVKRMIQSTLFNAQAAGADQNQDYWRGFQNALKAIAILLGIVIPAIIVMFIKGYIHL